MHATWWCKYFVFVVKKSLDEYVCGLTVFIVKDHLLFLLLLKTPLRSTSGFYIVKIKNRKNKSLALLGFCICWAWIGLWVFGLVGFRVFAPACGFGQRVLGSRVSCL
jgi:hypothetical protein